MSSSTGELIAQNLRKDGFRPGQPATVSLSIVYDDRSAYASSCCPECEHEGLAFQAWHRDREYRGLAICRKCRHAFEA